MALLQFGVHMFQGTNGFPARLDPFGEIGDIVQDSLRDILFHYWHHLQVSVTTVSSPFMYSLGYTDNVSEIFHTLGVGQEFSYESRHEFFPTF